MAVYVVGAEVKQASAIVDGEGRFSVARLPAGKYRIGFRTPIEGVFRCYLDPEVFELSPGEAMEREFDFERRRRVLRVVAADGSPCGDVMLTVRSKSCGYRWSFTTSGEGTLVLDPAPTVDCTVEVSEKLRGVLRVDGPDEVEIRLRPE